MSRLCTVMCSTVRICLIICLGLTSLEDGRKRGDLIEPYKIITEKENVKCDNFFKMSDKDSNRTRGH